MSAALYTPDPTRQNPVTLQTLRNRRARVIDGWREGENLIQIWRDKWFRLYQGNGGASWQEPAFYPVVEVE